MGNKLCKLLVLFVIREQRPKDEIEDADTPFICVQVCTS
jgi:hypothetical protein